MNDLVKEVMGVDVMVFGDDLEGVKVVVIFVFKVYFKKVGEGIKGVKLVVSVGYVLNEMFEVACESDLI